MAINFMPKEVKFFDYLNLQAENLVKATGYFKSVLKNGVMDETSARKIHDLENEGDTLMHEISDMLNRTFITPIDREDIFALANQLDDVLDLLNAMAGRMKLYKLDPGDEYFSQFIDLIDQSATALANAIKHMHDTKRARRVLDHCIEAHRLENMGDQVREKAISNLFETEKAPITVIKWKEMYDVAEGTLDNCEHVAKVIESILVKHG
jgi:predicted phosphate transport protein (TIGR00153 family)